MILSICIPTYNRCDFLKVMVNSLTSQLKENSSLSGMMEIIISDNCSDDGTEQYLQDLLNDNPNLNIKVIRNERNIGVVRNILKALENASGDFWYFIGDDDLIPSGALVKVIAELKSHPEIPVFIFKHKFYKNISGSEEISIYESAKRYAYFMGNAATVCSTKLSKLNAEKYYNEIVTTCWPQTHLYFLSMYSAGIIKPVKISDVEIFETQPRTNNNITNAFYHFDAQFHAFFRLVYMISEQVGDKKLINIFLKGIPFIHGIGFLTFIFNIMVKYNIYDYENEKEDYRLALNEAGKTLDTEHKKYLRPFKLAERLPVSFFKITHLYYRVIYESLRCIKNAEYSKILQTYKNEKLSITQAKELKRQKMKFKYAHSIRRGEW